MPKTLDTWDLPDPGAISRDERHARMLADRGLGFVVRHPTYIQVQETQESQPLLPAGHRLPMGLSGRRRVDHGKLRTRFID